MVPWTFHVDILIKRVWGRGVKKEVLAGPWGFLTGDMEDRVIPDIMIVVFYPKEDTLKILCWYLNWKCVRKGGSRRGVLGGRWGFLTGDMEDRVIPDVMNDVFLPQGRYPENLVLISQLEVCQEGGDKKGGAWRTLRVPDGRHGRQGHPWWHGWPCEIPMIISWNFGVSMFLFGWVMVM